MSDDVTEWSNPVHVERRCPLCRATRTRFVDVYSDGDEVVECSFSRQQCKGCGLSCKHWDAIDALTAELETERMKLAGCSVAALSNTQKTIAERLDRDNPYWSASYGDVCAAVDREMALTAENAELRKRVEGLEGSLKNMRRYSAVQGRLDDGEELAGLAYDGSIWGPCADPKYEMYELAESVEEWLHDKIDTALSQRKEGLS